MAVESWLNEQTPNRQRGRVFGIYMTITLVALGIGLFLAPWAGDPQRPEPFMLAAALFSLGIVPVALTPMPQPQPVAVPSIGLGRLLRESPLGFIGALASGVVNGAFWSVGALFWRGLGLTQQDTAVFMGLVIAGGALLQWPVGHISDFTDRRLVLVVVSFIAATLALLLLAVPPGAHAMLAVCALGFGGTMLAVYSLSVAHLNDRLHRQNALEGTRGLLLVYGIGAVVGPLVTGPLMQWLGPRMLAVVSAIALGSLGVFGLVRMTRRSTVPLVEQAPFLPLARTSQAVLQMLPGASHGSTDGQSPMKSAGS